MKKIFLMLMLAVAVASATSCKEGETIAVTYNVEIMGDADGDVNVEFPNGSIVVNGTTDLQFKYGNADLKSDATMLFKGRKYEKAFAAVQDNFASQFKAAAAKGTYYLSVKGYAEAYGVKISIDEVLTNRGK